MEPEFALVAVGAIVVIVAAAAFSSRLGVAAPLLLVLVGIGYSFIPGMPAIEVEPEIILMGVLPPILYAAAIQLPVVDFRRNFGSISALSVLLVVGSALLTGVVLFTILPDLDLAAAIALGAVIAPTDVVAATAIGKRLGLPPRLLSILEGEGLVNDATALVLLRSAIAATALSASGTFTAWGAVGDFAYAVVVALAVGLLVGVVAVVIRRRLDQPILDTAISFAVPFIAYIPAEGLGASGVIAVVAAGIYSGHQSARFTPQSRVAERLNWRTVQFILENGVFLIMGAQLSGIVTEIEEGDLAWHEAVALGVLLAGILMVLRFVFVWPLLGLVRRGETRSARAAQRATAFEEKVKAFDTRGSARAQRRVMGFLRRSEQARNDVKQYQAEGLGWRGGVVLGWAGMRGVVTLAAAQSLPRETPYYEQLVLIAFTVAIVTLLVQGGTLPFVIRLTGIRGTDRAADRRELATLLDEMEEAGLAALEAPRLELPDGSAIDPGIIDRVRLDTSLASAVAWERAEHADDDDGILQSPHQQYRELRREVLQAERDVLLDARARGAYPSRILQRAQTLLDLEESRLAQMESGGRD
ncbi:cation:proton antiporter [Pseudolysinimonas sp.]|jgi:NhaP-type Na+/H+ or K+/H+ antiporter|uniref:cation:proton antiporter n=1 Tax=Pseudolysinimonas sp. TaxID=2680009 RepID=UPI003783F4E5